MSLTDSIGSGIWVVTLLGAVSWAQDSTVTLEQQCATRDSSACYQLALRYRDGVGIPKDNDRAATFLGKACDLLVVGGRPSSQACFTGCLMGLNTCIMTGNDDPRLWEALRALLAEPSPEGRLKLVMSSRDFKFFREINRDPAFLEFAALPDLQGLRSAVRTRAIELARTDPGAGVRSWMTELVPREVLEEMAKNDPDPIVRKYANEKVNRFLPREEAAKKAIDDPDPTVRRMMVERLQDRSELAHIAEKDRDALVRSAAMHRMVELGSPDQGLLRRIAQKDADDQVRAQAVVQVKGQKLLERLARTDRSSGVRLSALLGLSDQATLAWVAEHDPDADNRLEATRRVTDQQVLNRIVRTSLDLLAQEAAVSRISDIGILTDIMRNATDPNARRLASELLQKLGKKDSR